MNRWLSNEQAAADSANFLANVKFPNISADLTAPGTPWIYYGVSLSFTSAELASVGDYAPSWPNPLRIHPGFT